MPTRKYQNFFQAYLERVANTEPSAYYHMWVCTQLIAPCLGRKCEVRFGPEKYFPNFYVILVGPPGARKGTSIRYGLDILKHVQRLTLAPDAVTRQQFFDELERSQDLVNLGEGNILNHCSIFVVADELAVFLGDNDPQRLADLCSMFDGKELFEYKTKHSGSNYIPNPSVWLLGATTPNSIESCMNQLAVGGGISSRIIFVYAPKKDKHIPLTQMQPFDARLEAGLINDLGMIAEMKGLFHVDSSGQSVFDKWYLEVYPREQPEDTRLSYFMDRVPAHVAKLSMVVSAAQRDDGIITGTDIKTAIKMLMAIIPNMTHAFGGMGLNILGRQTEMVRSLLRERGPLSKSIVMKTLRMHMNEYDYARIKMSLVSEKFLRPHFDVSIGEEILIPLEETTDDS